MLSREAQMRAAAERAAMQPAKGRRVRFRDCRYARGFAIATGTEGVASPNFEAGASIFNVHLDDGRYCTGVRHVDVEAI